jgi:predicted ribosome quality control (RQC) complex YloA/Tae2 family protein
MLQEKQKKSSIAKILSNAIVRIEKKILLHEEKIRELADMENLRLFGELITANLHELKDASGKANILNYYTNEMIEIKLDPELNAVQNAQKYFQKYSKAKRSLAGAVKQLEEARTELDYLESVSSALENSTTVQEISEIRDELAAQGYVPVSAGGKKKAAKKLPPYEFTSSDGYTIYVGRNNVQNDLLTLKSAGAGDMWLHTRNIPGSHVILVRKGDTFSDRAIYEASSLAAGHSKARLSQNVPVDHALVKFVKKPPGAKPGKVIYSNFKTLNVDPAKTVEEIQSKK